MLFEFFQKPTSACFFQNCMRNHATVLYLIMYMYMYVEIIQNWFTCLCHVQNNLIITLHLSKLHLFCIVLLYIKMALFSTKQNAVILSCICICIYIIIGTFLTGWLETRNQLLFLFGLISYWTSCLFIIWVVKS